MDRFAIVTDSAADLTGEQAEQLGVDVAALTFTLDEQTYTDFPDRSDIIRTDFYARLAAGARVRTSAPNVDAFLRCFEAHLRAGEDVLYLGFSSALSSTCQNAQAAAAELREFYPARRIETLDTRCASLGQAMLVALVCGERDRGRTFAQTLEFARERQGHICHWFTLSDLSFLRRGGRISAASAVLGGILNVKPIFHTDAEGRLTPVDKVRGWRQALTALTDRMDALMESRDPDQPVFIVHGDCEADARAVEQMVKQRFGCAVSMLNCEGAAIGAHTGPGVVGLFFLGRER